MVICRTFLGEGPGSWVSAKIIESHIAEQVYFTDDAAEVVTIVWNKSWGSSPGERGSRIFNPISWERVGESLDWDGMLSKA